jgi:hypothetical protein
MDQLTQAINQIPDDELDQIMQNPKPLANQIGS